MKLATYLAESKIAPSDFAARINVSSEAVRLYMLGRRVPRPKQMAAIISVTHGEVTANDFVEHESAA